MKLYMFRRVPLSIIRSFSLYTQQWYMSYRFDDSLRAGSGWNAEMSASSWFYYKKFITMHDHINFKPNMYLVGLDMPVPVRVGYSVGLFSLSQLLPL
jgi:hypothetical protein